MKSGHRRKRIRVIKILSVFFMMLMLSIFICSTLTVYSEKFDCKAGKHDYAVTVKKATKNKEGEKVYTCRICGYTFTRILPATGHIWSKWITDKQPTCTGSGHKYRICTKYPSDPHKEEEIIPKRGHSYKVKITPPTCTKRGFKTYTCERCGDTYMQPFGGKALGHSYMESITKQPDCEYNGEKTYTCKVCGHTYTRILPASGHLWSDWIIDKEPTGETEGHKYRVCEHNRHHILEETIPKLSLALPASAPLEKHRPSLNRVDMILLSLMAAMAGGFGITIHYDLRILRWDRKQCKPFKEWWKSNH